MKTKLNRILLIFVLFLSVTFILNSTGNQTEPTEPQDLSPQSIEIKQGSPKMEHVLYRLMKTYYEQGIEKAKEFADRRGITIKNNNVRVVTEAKIKNDFQEETTTKDTGAVSDIKETKYLVSEQIKALGGKVETSYLNLIQCVIPIDGLEEITKLPYIKYLRLPKHPTPLVISEGVETTDADQWQNVTPYRTNETVKVCILDLGFKGYQNLLGSELPDNVVTRSFRSDGNLKYDKHGTACAEIVHDMAPNAELYLVNFNTDVEHYNAVKWIINQEVDIISYSVGWFNIGAGDGTGPICEDVEDANSNGIIWVSAAGNDANNHWEGNYKDYDNDKWHNFSGSDEILTFHVNAYTLVSAHLNWNDWGYWDGNSYEGSDQDFDLYLYYWNGYYWQYVDGSFNWQTGYQLPIEFVGGYWYSSVSSWWGVSIRKYNANQNVKHELFINGASGSIEYNEKSGSLNIPADSSDAIAVGATDWSDDSLHYYSSRGPTSDNRIKPDFSAPSGVSGVTYGTVSFYGTSASTPHVAGALALLKEKFPYTLNQIKSILEARAKDLGPSGKDNLFGIGRLKLSK
jgi:subtilisin family serine protease